MSSSSSQAADTVFVRGLEFEGNHGYTAAERRSTRRFRVNIELSHALGRAAHSDKLGDTVDYRQLCEIALEVGRESTYKLLESVAGDMATRIADHYPEANIRIELEKLAPPCPGVPESCGIVLNVPARSAG